MLICSAWTKPSVPSERRIRNHCSLSSPSAKASTSTVSPGAMPPTASKPRLGPLRTFTVPVAITSPAPVWVAGAAVGAWATAFGSVVAVGVSVGTAAISVSVSSAPSTLKGGKTVMLICSAWTKPSVPSGRRTRNQASPSSPDAKASKSMVALGSALPTTSWSSPGPERTLAGDVDSTSPDPVRVTVSAGVSVAVGSVGAGVLVGAWAMAVGSPGGCCTSTRKAATQPSVLFGRRMRSQSPSSSVETCSVISITVLGSAPATTLKVAPGPARTLTALSAMIVPTPTPSAT